MIPADATSLFAVLTEHTRNIGDLAALFRKITMRAKVSWIDNQTVKVSDAGWSVNMTMAHTPCVGKGDGTWLACDMSLALRYWLLTIASVSAGRVPPRDLSNISQYMADQLQQHVTGGTTGGASHHNGRTYLTPSWAPVIRLPVMPGFQTASAYDDPYCAILRPLIGEDAFGDGFAKAVKLAYDPLYWTYRIDAASIVRVPNYVQHDVHAISKNWRPTFDMRDGDAIKRPGTWTGDSSASDWRHPAYEGLALEGRLLHALQFPRLLEQPKILCRLSREDGGIWFRGSEVDTKLTGVMLQSAEASINAAPLDLKLSVLTQVLGRPVPVGSIRCIDVSPLAHSSVVATFTRRLADAAVVIDNTNNFSSVVNSLPEATDAHRMLVELGSINASWFTAAEMSFYTTHK